MNEEAVWDAVIEDMKARDRLGRERYGVPLAPHNGRDALQDAYEEALDLAVYLKQAIIERDGQTTSRQWPRLKTLAIPESGLWKAPKLTEGWCIHAITGSIEGCAWVFRGLEGERHAVKVTRDGTPVGPFGPGPVLIPPHYTWYIQGPPGCQIVLWGENLSSDK